jgi:hypothetical protein
MVFSEFPEGDSKKTQFFCPLENYLLNCMFGLPDISVIVLGTVVVVIIIALVDGGLKLNPESSS